LQPPNLIALDGQRHRNTLDNHVTVADMASAAAYPPALAASLRAASKARIVNFAATAHGVRSDSCRSCRKGWSRISAVSIRRLVMMALELEAQHSWLLSKRIDHFEERELIKIRIPCADSSDPVLA